MKILVTGAAGYLGSVLCKSLLEKGYEVRGIDAGWYGTEQIKECLTHKNFEYIESDIRNLITMVKALSGIDGVIHLAAESHVDRSITDPLAFAKTNILGTMILLNAFKKLHKNNWNNKRFYHVSTDEVYGSLGETGLFKESTSYDPNSPYSASKASSDHFVRAYGETYGLPYVITNCSNNYGQQQFPEKLIPLFINNILN